jgi:hypothetical protein
VNSDSNRFAVSRPGAIATMSGRGPSGRKMTTPPRGWQSVTRSVVVVFALIVGCAACHADTQTAPSSPAGHTAPASVGTSTAVTTPNPNGDGSAVPCEGSICSNPNHGAGTDPGDNGGAMMPNPNGDGSAVPCEGSICSNPNHGAGTDPGDNGGAMMPNPNGDGSAVPCEGSICTNPNHGAG